MYGVFIRDSVAGLRAGIQATVDQTNVAIKKGKPNAKEVAGDGVLQGAELKKAQAAVKDLQKAITALKPVYRDGPILNPIMPGSSTGVGGVRPMYGVVFRDDLAAFRDQISESSTQIRAAVKNGTVQGAAKTEAQKALKYLDAALKELNRAGKTWS